MKIQYSKLILLFALLWVGTNNLQAQVRIVQVNPATNAVKLHNYGNTNQDVSSYFLCSLFSYGQINAMTIVSGDLDMMPGADLTVTSLIDFNTTAADLGLYDTNSFGSITAMQDFVQWGSGGNGRENVAVAKGIWTANTFISLPAPYQYNGDGAQNGAPFWITSLSIQKNNVPAAFEISSNPAKSHLTIEFYNSQQTKHIKVFDVLGKQIHSENIDSGMYADINVSNWNKGIYIVKIETTNASQSKRFIKN